MKRKILAMLTCLGIILGLGMGTSNVAMAAPRVQECGACGSMSLNTYRNYGGWIVIATEPCPKFPGETDFIERRMIYDGYNCMSCGYNWFMENGWEQRTYCVH